MIKNNNSLNTVPSKSILESICNVFGITLLQFFSDNDMVELSPELKKLFEGWITLTPEQKSAVLHVVNAFSNNNT